MYRSNKNLINFLRRAALAIVMTAGFLGIIAIGGCGGGGGGGSSGPGYSVSPGSLTFSAASASSPTPAPQKITITISGGTVYLAAFRSGSAIADATFAITGQTTAEVTVFPASPASLGVGTFSGKITVLGCNDPQCNSQVSGSPKDINVTYQIGGLSISPSSVDLSAVEGTASTVVPVNISNVTGSTSWASSISYSGNTVGWLTVAPPSGSTLPATLNFSGGTLAAGTYSAIVTITAGSNFLPIPVTYTVSASSLTLTPAFQTFSIDAASTPTDAFLKRTVTTGATGAPLSWTASSSVPWLTVTGSGTSGDSATLTLVPAQMGSLDSGALSAPVTFTYSGPGVTSATTTLGVTLVLSLPKVNYVAPYVALTNTSKEVILRGSGFSQPNLPPVMFGSQAAQSVDIRSDTEIRATHPNLSAGSYPLQVQNNLGIQSPATLVVMDTPNYPAASIAYPNATAKQVLDIVYDAERQALIVAVAYPAPGALGDIFRYPYSAASWAASPTTQFIPSFRGMGSSTDGQKLIALSGLSVVPVDPVSLATGTSTTASAFSASYLSHVVSTSDGYAFITSGFNGSGSTPAFRYNVRNPGLTVVGSFLNFHFGSPGASSNGDHITVIQGGGVSPAPDVYRFDATDASIVTTGLTRNQNFLIPPVLDRAPSRIIMDGYAVYDTSYTQVGSLPFVSLGTQSAVALSPDGTRAYSYVDGTTLHTYDLTAPPVAGIYPEIGTGITLAGNPGSGVKMTISPDGGTVFLAGGSQIVIQPVP